jgi:hypothetical protein
LTNGEKGLVETLNGRCMTMNVVITASITNVFLTFQSISHKHWPIAPNMEEMLLG